MADREDGCGSPEHAVLLREVATLRARVADLQRAAARHQDDDEDNEDGLTLAAREELLREVERIAHLGTWTWEPESGRVTWSGEMFRILGLDPDAVAPSVEAFYQRVHPEDLPRALENKADQARDGVLPLTELRIVRPDGSVRHTTTTSVILFDDSGVQRRIVGGVLDRTESLSAELTLRRTLALLEEAQRTAQLGSWRFDLMTGELEWSREFLRIFGLPPDTPGDPGLLLERFPPDQRAQVHAIHEQLMAGQLPETPLSGEARLLRADGGERHVRFETRAVQVAEGHHELRGTLLDVTEDVRMRRELIEAQKTEAIGRLAGGIAHDFNNLLMVISGNMQVLERALGPRAEIASSIRALESAASLTRRLLALGRKAQLALQPTDVNRMLRATTTMLRRLVGDDVQIVLSLARELPAVSVDPVEIERALVNLVVNARDVMPTGGVVQISSARADLDGAPAVAISVADEGPGVSAGDLPHIFEPFFTTRDGVGGTGLGLATVLGTAQQHGGTVQVHPREQGGTVFTILLPAAKDAPQPVPVDGAGRRPPAAPAASAQRRRLLVVDDEVAVATVMGKLLRSAGYAVRAASSPDEALSTWREHGATIDLVLCDVALGTTRGPELVERMAAVGPAPRVLFITGYSEEAAQSRLGHPVLAKPFNLKALIAAISAALER